jgi:hypothetical protein
MCWRTGQSFRLETPHAVELAEAERAQVRALVGRGIAPARMLTRARILLKADQGERGPGWSDGGLAGAPEVHPNPLRHRIDTNVGRSYTQSSKRFDNDKRARVCAARRAGSLAPRLAVASSKVGRR